MNLTQEQERYVARVPDLVAACEAAAQVVYENRAPLSSSAEEIVVRARLWHELELKLSRLGFIP